MCAFRFEFRIHKYYIVTANTRGGFMRNSALLWARGQDAFLVIRGTRDRFWPTAMLECKVDPVSFRLKGNPLHLVTPM